jgi:hypothetical protein
MVRNELATGNITDLGQASTNAFLGCGDYVDSIILAVENGTDMLYFVNGDGQAYLYGKINGAGGITGLAYDEVSSTIYIVGADASNSYLYTLDLATLDATLVGTIGAYLVIGIAADNAGNLYGIELDTDNFLSIDKSSGAGTVIGATGLDLRYAQDIGSDRVNNIIYGTLYNDATPNQGGGFYTFDISTGQANLILLYEDEITMCAIVPAANNPTYNVSFTVTDLSNNPIDGANIAIDGNSITTDTVGHASTSLENGTYTVITSKTGFGNDTISITVADADLIVDTIKLEPVAWLQSVNNDKLVIYPNPTDGIFYVKVDNAEEIEYIKVSNIAGQVIFNTNKNYVDINNQPAGIYFVEVKVDGQILNRKIIKK